MSKVTTTFEAVDTGMVATINKIERETKSMKDTTEKTEKQFKTSFSAMAAAGAGLAVGIGAIKGAFAALTGTIDNFGQALDMGGKLSDLSVRTGETAGNLLLLERAFDNSGVGADKVGSSINKLQKFMSAANSGAEDNMLALAELGLSYESLVAKSPTEQLRYVAEGVKAIKSPTERAAMAMKIFGKSGGELLPLLQNFSGELENAQSEIGSMANIMDRKAAVFDTISDKLAVIKGKFTEFAVGLLSNVTPALELFTTLLAKIDVAGIGARLTNGAMKFFDILVGAFHNGVEAAKALDSAMMYGVKSFGNGILNSIIDAGNSIGVQMIGGFKIAVNSFKGMFMQAVASSISFLAEKMIAAASLFGDEAESKARAIADPLISSVKDGAREYALEMKNANDKIGNDMVKIMEGTRKSTQDFFGAGEEFKKLESSLKKIGDEGERFRKGLIGDEKESNPLKPMEESAQKISLQMRKTGDDLKGIKADAKEISAIQKMREDLNNAKIEKKTGINTLEENFKNQLKDGKFTRAEKTIEKIKEKEKEKLIRSKENGDFDRRSIDDIAKDLGIKTFGKSKKDLIEEIAKRRGDIEEKMKNDPKKRDDKEPAKPKEDQLIDIVKMIKEIVGKIEPKLPQRALI